MTQCIREFSASAWECIAEIRERIEQLPPLTQLTDDALKLRRFVEYIVQDDFYLRGYSRALALLVARAPHTKTHSFWTRSAEEAVAAETLMHDIFLDDPLLRSAPRAAAPSLAIRGYVNFTQIAVAYDPCPVGVATVLPCYQVYAQVDLDLAERAGAMENHPYGTWVAAYADPTFQETTAVAIELLDEAAEAADDMARTAVLDAFADTTRYEELFWERSHCLEAWVL